MEGEANCRDDPISNLRTTGDDSIETGISAAMEGTWTYNRAARLPGASDLLGDRHRIIANDWHAAHELTTGRSLHRFTTSDHRLHTRRAGYPSPGSCSVPATCAPPSN